MFGSVVIDVVIAMALVFFVFSLVTSGLREVVAWLGSTRSKVLWRSVRELLDDPISCGLQPVYEAVAEQDDAARLKNSQKVRDTEDSLRASRDEETTSVDWNAAVDETMKQLRTNLTQDATTPNPNPLPENLAASLTDATKRLKKAYTQPKGLSAFASLFWRRGSEGRPTSPVVPTIGNVTAIAQGVHDGIRTFTDAVYDHPLVRQVDKTVAGKKSQLTWLASGDFSGAALDLIQAAGVDKVIEDRWAGTVDVIAGALGAEKKNIATQLGVALKDVKEHIATGTATTASVGRALDTLVTQLTEAANSEPNQQAIRDAIDDLKTRLLKIEPLDLIEQGLEALENIGPVRDTVSRAAAAARDTGAEVATQLSEVTASIGAWYDGRMASLTVWYRKRSRFVGFVLAFLVVVGFNVDAIDLPRELWQSESIRSALVAVAETSELDLAQCVDEGAADGGTDKDIAECVEDVEAVLDQLIDTGLPVGWTVANGCNGACSNPLETAWYSAGADDTLMSGLLKVVGWMLAAAALSMGASFWFDVMRRAMGIKAATKDE
jgi:hypothetical protein